MLSVWKLRVLETHGCHSDNFFEVCAVYEGIRHCYKQVGVGVTNLLQAVVDKCSFFSFQNTCKETRFYHRFERENRL